MIVPDTIGGVVVWPGPPQALMTMERMRDLTNATFQNPFVVATAIDIFDDVNGKDAGAMAAALLAWLRGHTRFIPDPLLQQVLKSPVYMLERIRDNDDHRAGGDCVDVAMLAAALAMAVGMTPKFIAESYARPCHPRSSPLVHVYTVVQTQSGFKHLDVQQPADGSPLVPCRRVELALPS